MSRTELNKKIHILFKHMDNIQDRIEKKYEQLEHREIRKFLAPLEKEIDRLYRIYEKEYPLYE